MKRTPRNNDVGDAGALTPRRKPERRVVDVPEDDRSGVVIVVAVVALTATAIGVLLGYWVRW